MTRLVLVHGRDNQGLDAEQLDRTWTEVLDAGLAAAGTGVVVRDADTAFVYYGDTLAALVGGATTPPPVTVHAVGAPRDGVAAWSTAEAAEEAAFVAAVAEEVLRAAGATVPARPEGAGPGGVEGDVGAWLNLLLSALDRSVPGLSGAVVALLAVAGAWLVWRFFVDTFAGQMLERAAFDGAVTGQGELWAVAEPVLDTVSVAFVVGGLGAAMGIALLRRRWGLAVQVAFLVVGANVTTQLVKHSLLGREELIGGWHWENSLPSGHTTVAGSVAAALLLVVPRGARPLVAVLGGAYTAATGVSTLVGQWHRPSDVVAAVLVVLAWAALVCVFTPRSSLDPGAGPTPGSTVTAVLLLLGAAAAGVAAALALRAT
ncbi:phosphatase PAP2 family protein, partial [Cellulosimicrobium funkei]|uniref:phosphatase PAP2 family protein n=1 Tax=Cellulosimicrobium funkei TaxID=264251 RepID=UPI0037563730